MGAGISGLAAATALHTAGWDPVIVERADARRRGGYFIAMYGCGRIAAERIGIRGIRNRIAATTTRQVDRQGHAKAGLGFGDLPGDPWMMLRGDVEQAAFEALPPGTELRFDTTPTAISQDADGATVTLHDTRTDRTTTERFDLVIGADGLRSTVRKLVWGPDQDYLHPLGFMITAFELPEALPGLPSREGAILSEPGRSFWVFPFADRPPTVLFSYQTDDVAAERARARQVGVVERLREVYGPQPLGELMETSLQHLERADEFLFDSVEQAKVDRWHRGRVVLLGDSAWCPTLYSGMGATSGLAGADLLGLTLQRHPGDLETALSEWERKLRPAIADFQQSAFPMRMIFTQTSAREQRSHHRSLGLRKLMFRLPLLKQLLARTRHFRLRNGDLAAAT